MAEPRQGSSGAYVFAACFVLIVAGIVATVLLANDGRHLASLLEAVGYPKASQFEEVAGSSNTTPSKGARLAPMSILIPAFAFADLKAPEQAFVRFIQSEPTRLCDQLKTYGFVDLTWTTSMLDDDNWECSSFIKPADMIGNTMQSSVFVSIRGDGENRVTSFRLKMNLEHPSESKALVELGGSVVSAFLKSVRWEQADDIVQKIHSLEPFQVSKFGSRIEFKKEFGETPRYNFLAFQSATGNSSSLARTFFDRNKWFPLVFSDRREGLER